MEPEVRRILDANINRAREALRVVEDYARFVLDDPDLASACKRRRHELRSLATEAGGSALLEARDITGDVGRDLKTPGELKRESFEDVVQAAFARLTEAGRALGEYGKLVSPQAARSAETLRYGAYELEQRVLLRGGLRARFRAVRLYVLITADLCRADWYATAEAAIRGGAGCLQLREKALPDGELLARARRLRELTARHGVLFAVNDRPDIARLAGADIVHVGQEDLPVAEVRRIAGPTLLVGKSTHTPGQLRAALQEEPDYVAVGPMFPTGTKPQAQAAGPPFLAEAVKSTELPLVAIGGIQPGNVRAVVEAGGRCVAVCSAVVGAEDPEAAARNLLEALEG